MTQIIENIINELDSLPEEKQEEAYLFVLSLKTKKNNMLEEKMKEGYLFLAEEHLNLCNHYGGNDET